MVLVRKAAAIRQCELLGNWLYGVAYRTALDARSMATRRRLHERQVDAMPEPEMRDCSELGIRALEIEGDDNIPKIEKDGFGHLSLIVKA